MYYEEIGDRNKPTIIMLHAAGMVECFTKQYVLGEHYHLVVPHLYGNGEEAEKKYEVQECIEGIADIIRGLGKEKVVLVGFSLGAELAIPLLCKYEQYFSQAILVSPWICKSEQVIEEALKTADLMKFVLKKPYFLKVQAKKMGLNKELTEQFIRHCHALRGENFVAMIKEGIVIEDYKEFRDLTIPMLALVGEKENKDMIISAEMLEKLNPNCKSIVVDKLGHNIPFKNSEKFNQIITDFITFY